MPANAGIQDVRIRKEELDPGLRRVTGAVDRIALFVQLTRITTLRLLN
jgi:hypothetical protein